MSNALDHHAPPLPRSKRRACRTNPRAPVVVALTGLIGAGKSTLGKRLAAYLNAHELSAVYVPEPINRENLKAFYEDPQRLAYWFQTSVYRQRVNSVCDAYDAEPNADVYVLDRSVFCDRFFFFELICEQPNWVHPAQRVEYDEWWHMWSVLLPFDIDGFVYLRPDIDACMARLVARGRAGEELISLDYQQKLLAKHDAFFVEGDALTTTRGVAMPRPFLRLDEQRNFRDDASVADSVCSSVLQWMRTQLALAQ